MADLQIPWFLLPLGLILLWAIFTALKSGFSQRDNSAKTRRERTIRNPVERPQKFSRVFRRSKSSGSDIFR